MLTSISGSGTGTCAHACEWLVLVAEYYPCRTMAACIHDLIQCSKRRGKVYLKGGIDTGLSLEEFYFTE